MPIGFTIPILSGRKTSSFHQITEKTSNCLFSNPSYSVKSSFLPGKSDKEKIIKQWISPFSLFPLSASDKEMLARGSIRGGLREEGHPESPLLAKETSLNSSAELKTDLIIADVTLQTDYTFDRSRITVPYRI